MCLLGAAVLGVVGLFAVSLVSAYQLPVPPSPTECDNVPRHCQMSARGKVTLIENHWFKIPVLDTKQVEKRKTQPGLEAFPPAWCFRSWMCIRSLGGFMEEPTPQISNSMSPGGDGGFAFLKPAPAPCRFGCWGSSRIPLWELLGVGVPISQAVGVPCSCGQEYRWSHPVN